MGKSVTEKAISAAKASRAAAPKNTKPKSGTEKQVKTVGRSLCEFTTEQLQEGLQKYFGFRAFKGEQIAAIHSLLAGKDTFVIMPTGGGKSLCYQLPAMMCDGVAIIVSPLIALMKNQG